VDKVAGILEVSRTVDGSKIAIKHCQLQSDGNEMSHIVLSPRQARHFANVLIMHAGEAENEETQRPGVRGAGG
jgi:hypothetical protein